MQNTGQQGILNVIKAFPSAIVAQKARVAVNAVIKVDSKMYYVNIACIARLDSLFISLYVPALLVTIACRWSVE